MSIKLLKKLFHKPLFDNVEDINVKSITIKDIPVMLEVYEVFEPYFKEAKYYELLTEKTTEVLIFIYLCTSIEPSKLSDLGATKLIPLFDKCLAVNLDFFIQTCSMKKSKELIKQRQESEKPKRQPSKILQSRIVSTYKDL